MKLLFSLAISFFCMQSFAQPSSFSARGIGGGGALFFPKINPADNNEFYISCDMSQLFHSTDFGDNYSQIHYSKLQVFNLSTYEFTNNPMIAYCNFNDGNNGYPVKTIDGGNAWLPINGFDANKGSVKKMFANYNKPQQIIMNYFGSIVISNDGGNNFSTIATTNNNNAGIVCCGVFYDNNDIYVATNETLLYHSSDGGVNFNAVSTSGLGNGEVLWHFSAAKSGNTMRFLVITANAADVYNMVMPYDYYGFAKGVYTMDNANGTWVAKSTGINFSSDYVMYTGMAENNISTMYLSGNDNALGAPLIYKSTDAGSTWNKVFKSTNNQNIKTGWSGYQGDKAWSWGETAFGIAVAPNDANKVVFGDFAFVHVSSDGGTNWKQAYIKNSEQHNAGAATPKKQSYTSIGLENTTCWQIHWKDAQTMFGCFSDNGGIKSADAGNTWSFNYNGFTVNSLYRMEQTPNGNIYGACSNIHDMYQSTYLADSKLDANDANGKIVFSTDGGNNFNLLHSFSHPVFWLAADPNNSNRMYASVIHYSAGTGQGGIWVCNDLNNGASSVWTKLSNPPRTEGHPACIRVLKDGKVLCTYSGRRNSSGTFTASSGVFIYDPGNSTWTDKSHSGMNYWTKDIVIDPNDTTQNTWYVAVFSGWGGAPNGLGGLYKTSNRGTNWTKLTGSLFDRVTSVTFNPSDLNEAYLTTETQGLWVSKNMNAITPSWNNVVAYPFRQPERVYFNPYNANEMWVSSFGNGMKMGLMTGGSGINFTNTKLKFQVSPNPTTDILHIYSENANTFGIYNSIGTLIYSCNIQKECDVDISTFSKGIYWIIDEHGNSLKWLKE